MYLSFLSRMLVATTFVRELIMMNVRKDEIAMKKFIKFLVGTFSLVTAICGVYYLLKHVFHLDNGTEDFDDFEDEFDEFETESSTSSDSREYVPINFPGSDDETAEQSSTNTNDDNAFSENEDDTSANDAIDEEDDSDFLYDEEDEETSKEEE